MTRAELGSALLLAKGAHCFGPRWSFDSPSFHPKEKGNKPPQLIPNIDASFQVSTNQLADCGGIKNPAALNLRRGERFEQQRAKKTPKPFVHWYIETGLFPFEHEPGELAPHQLAKQVLLLQSSNLEIFRQRCCKFYNAVVEKRWPHFQRVRHAHTIHFLQNVAGQVRQLVDEQVAV